LDRTTEILTITSIDQIPSLDSFQNLNREQTLKLIFKGTIQEQREIIGNDLKKKLPGFQVSIHNLQSEINVVKLITDKEIQENQLFFEKCAKDYRDLGEFLIFKLADKLGIEINKDSLISSFHKFKRSKKQLGKVNEWKYYLHGIHCGFQNEKTGQIIEVCLVFGLEFGDLDPYFFSRFIKSTSEYKPLPVEIYEDYADGVRIIDEMLLLGKFERIDLSKKNYIGVVVADKNKFAET
jgi:hypothetical protein